MPIYKLAAFDMDGTLLNSRKQIPDSAVSACRRAQKAGRIIAVDTGRAVSELTPFSFAEMGIRYGSCACGTVIYDFQEGRVLAKRTIPFDLVPLIVEASRREDLLFQAMIDASCVYVNASTRFTDGGEFGFGAELGISTQKLHARGPMGIKVLTTTKYLIDGEGQIR